VSGDHPWKRRARMEKKEIKKVERGPGKAEEEVSWKRSFGQCSSKTGVYIGPKKPEYEAGGVTCPRGREKNFPPGVFKGNYSTQIRGRGTDPGGNQAGGGGIRTPLGHFELRAVGTQRKGAMRSKKTGRVETKG